MNKTIIKRMGLPLLKLECIFNVSNTCKDELVKELHFLTPSASGLVIKKKVLHFDEAWLYFEGSVISELIFASSLLLREWMGLKAPTAGEST